jgi:DNA-binding NarL/FixJ family response regulator
MRHEEKPAPEHQDRPRVLVVDPNDADRACAAEALRADGIDVVADVGSHADGLRAAQAHRPTVIVTELDGGRLLPTEAYVFALRRQSQGASVVIYSTQRPSNAQFVDWGIYGSAVKREPLADLCGVVRRAHDHGVRHARR